MAPVRKGEEEVGRMWDRCFIDTSFKAVGGTVIGTIFSFLFFKRKAWPITLGLGVGIGAGYTNCRHQFWWSRSHGPQGHFGRGPGHAHPPFWGPPGFRRRDWGKKEAASPEQKPYTEIPATQEKPTEEVKPADT